MDIYEDGIYGSEKNEENNKESYTPDTAADIYSRADFLIRDSGSSEEEVKETKRSNDSGMRIIYQAPEKTAEKKDFVGFKDEDLDNVPDYFETAEETVNEYKGGFAFEEEMLKNQSVPKRRPVPRGQAAQDRKINFEEEKRRRYYESLKKAEEERARAERTRAAVEGKRAVLIIDSDVGKVKSTYVSKKNVGEKVRVVVLIIAIIAMLVSVTVLVKQYIQQRQGSDWEDEVTGLLIDVDEETTDSNKKKKKKNSKEESTTERVLTIEEQWAKLYKDYPNVKFPEGLSLKYAKLYAVNQDFVGYISIDNFGVGLPVVQSKKDTEEDNYYLRKSFYKKYSVYGCPFVPKNNDMKNLDRNTVIFGHNNNSNIAFAPVNKYKTVDGYKQAPVIQFDTVYGNHKWKIVAAFIINTKAKDDNGYIFNYTFTKMEDDEEFMNYISFVKERSLYDTGVDILPTDKILTLSTCTHDFDDARFVVVARLVRPGETEDVNTSVAKVNEKPRYPQAYYKKKKKKNPYKDAERWFYSGN